jgi:pyrimidine operon attenuation protein / uracil phosphoribosyltransferase
MAQMAILMQVVTRKVKLRRWNDAFFVESANIPAMRVLADQQRVSELIRGLADAIAKDMSRAPDEAWALVGIRSRGDVLAERIAPQLKPDHVGTLDITLYRDDLSQSSAQPIVRTTEIDFSIDGINVVLVDDVLMTGRSIRAALQSLMDMGRPKRVWLAVLVDRGMRELPISPDHVALDLSGTAGSRSGSRDATQDAGDVGRGGGTVAEQVAADELVIVRLTPTDDADAIGVISAGPHQGPGSPVRSDAIEDANVTTKGGGA